MFACRCFCSVGETLHSESTAAFLRSVPVLKQFTDGLQSGVILFGLGAPSDQDVAVLHQEDRIFDDWDSDPLECSAGFPFLVEEETEEEEVPVELAAAVATGTSGVPRPVGTVGYHCCLRCQRFRCSIFRRLFRYRCVSRH